MTSPTLPSYCQRCKWSQSPTSSPTNRICRHPVTLTTQDWQLSHTLTSQGPCIFYTFRSVTY